MMWFLLLFSIYRPIPRVLFLTSSFDGKGMLPTGAHLALEEFSRHGAFVTFHDKSILYCPDSLKQFNIIIAPTSYGYHDVDQPLSLTFLDTISMNNIVEWIKNGGFFIAGGNIGRNTLYGKDRILSGNILTRDEWPLGRAFGFDMVEIDIKGFELRKTNVKPDLFDWYDNPVRPAENTDDWLLVPVNVKKDVRNFMVWTNGKKSYGGVTLREYGRGYAMLLSSFLLLHPSFDGGWADVPQITRFYHNLVMFTMGVKKYPTGVDPWPDGKKAVLAVTLDDGGKMSMYQLTLNSLLERVPSLTFFVTGKLEPKILNYIKKFKQVEIGNHSFNHPFFRNLNLNQSIAEIKMTQKVIGKSRVFRFPFVNYTPEGLYALWTHGFKYESSIRVDHMNTFRGAIFPYNLVFSFGKNLVTTDLIELSPIKSDWFFYQKIYADNYPLHERIASMKAFKSYLETMWSIIKDARGMMIQMGHPMYEGYNKDFLKPLLEFLDEVRAEKNIWITNLGGIYDWWAELTNVNVEVEEQNNQIRYKIFNRNQKEVKEFSVWIELEKSGVTPRLKFSKSRGYYTVEHSEKGEKIHVIMTIPPGYSSVTIKF